MSSKKKHLIELYLKYSKYIYTAKENLKVNEDFLRASFQSINDEDFNRIIDENGISQFTEGMISIVDSNFSEDEVKSLIDFFSSPVGRKLVNKSYLSNINKIINDITIERQRMLSKIEKE